MARNAGHAAPQEVVRFSASGRLPAHSRRRDMGVGRNQALRVTHGHNGHFVFFPVSRRLMPWCGFHQKWPEAGHEHIRFPENP
ncbi:MAG: hypothetical protein LBF93_02535, partial [Zoogloeaceae bacterium]|nr:hypothetical protein [Zoogloeaceae bacterium]